MSEQLLHLERLPIRLTAVVIGETVDGYLEAKDANHLTTEEAAAFLEQVMLRMRQPTQARLLEAMQASLGD